MAKKKLIPVLFAAIPWVMLTVAIPFVNRVEPTVFGMPFLLAWILFNVMLAPVWLWLAFSYEKRQRKLTHIGE